MNMEAKISTAHEDLDPFGQGGPAIQAPTTITDRMHSLLVTRADALARRLHGRLARGGGTRGLGECD
jgi:hypothetical protein